MPATMAAPTHAATVDRSQPCALPPLTISALAGTIRPVAWCEMANPDAIHGWDALTQLASEPNPFYESWYLLPSLRALDPEGAVRLLRFEVGGDLAGLLPFRRERRNYRRPVPHVGNWAHPNCFLGAPLVARGLERPFWRALLAWCDANAGMALFLHLAQIPLEGPLHEALVAVLLEQGRHHALVHREDRALLRSNLDAEAYLEASLSGKKRKELRRQFTRLSEAGTLAVERRDDDKNVAEWIETFLKLESAGWKGEAGSALAAHGDTAALFRQSIASAATRGKLERLSLTLDGRPIAMLASFLSPPIAFSYKTAFDESYSRFSPGVLLQRENLGMLERPGITACDSCAAADHPMIASSTLGTGNGTSAGNGSTSDVGLLGTNNRRRSVNFSAGLGYQIDGHSEIALEGQGSLIRYKTALNVNKYNSFGGSAGYSRDVNAHVRLGLQGSVDVTDYFSTLSKTTVYSGVATIKAKLSERWTLDGKTGFSHLNIANGKGRDGFTAKANLCYKSSTQADFCANASRGFTPSGTSGTSIQTSVGGSYNYRLSAKDSIYANANYVKNENSGLFVVSSQNDYITALFGYYHQQTRPLALSVNASYQKVTGLSVAQTDDYGGYVTLTYHLGDMR